MRNLPFNWARCCVAAIGAASLLGAAPGALAQARQSLAQRAADERDIQNLMGYYEEYQSALDFKDVVPLFAIERPDVKWAVGPGVYRGPEAVKAVLMAQEARPTDSQWMAIHDGEMHVHTLSTPIIVVAGDGQTAKATWDSSGLETLSGVGHKPDARWAWCKYGVDFVRTKSGWRIWHMLVTGLTFNRYDKSWVDAPGFPPIPTATDVGGEWPKPTEPQTVNWLYSGKGVPPLLPRPPIAYRTFSETFSY